MKLTAHGESWATAAANPEDCAKPRDTQARNGSNNCRDLMVVRDTCTPSMARQVGHPGSKRVKRFESRDEMVGPQPAEVSMSVESPLGRKASQLSDGKVKPYRGALLSFETSSLDPSLRDPEAREEASGGRIKVDQN
jgi:hypothetical protein